VLKRPINLITIPNLVYSHNHVKICMYNSYAPAVVAVLILRYGSPLGKHSLETVRTLEHVSNFVDNFDCRVTEFECHETEQI
jgi:hypothetical protein